jgi:U3 small nucleolar ribonucleoprotein component
MHGKGVCEIPVRKPEDTDTLEDLITNKIITKQVLEELGER